jgi:hypothetical protein
MDGAESIYKESGQVLGTREGGLPSLITQKKSIADCCANHDNARRFVANCCLPDE